MSRFSIRNVLAKVAVIFYNENLKTKNYGFNKRLKGLFLQHFSLPDLYHVE